MTGTVYPVTGGMEDWAYSGSWEGAPIITQPCKPTTYGGYDPEKTLYDKNYKDALKSIMFLLEVSHEKIPEQKFLGSYNYDCLVNIRQNAFFNTITPHKNLCLDEVIDGYIPRIIRLSLLLIDILKPYVNYRINNSNSKNLIVEWLVGGAITVDETFILFDYFDEIPTKEFEQKVLSEKDLKLVQNSYLKKSTEVKKGKGIWHEEYSTSEFFSNNFDTSNKNRKFLVFVIYAKVDQNWAKQKMPDPNVPPQTHISNIRINGNYTAKNGKYEIKGQLYFSSKMEVFDNTKIKYR